MGRFKAGSVLAGTPYQIVRHLATGGMGAVYEVEDTSVGRLYVLKTLHPEMVDREDLALRMREEARALGRLDHPNIVSVITAGVTADTAKTPFYVMERLVGQNLRTVIEARGKLGRAHAYRIGIDILEALQHAHEKGMIHRDVKPENIFLHRGKNGTETKLLDFGIVRLLSKHASLTRGKFIGTLRYASPEQVTGRPLGPATDIYSAVLVIYEMLRGSGPFDSAGDGYAIGAAHVGMAPPSLNGLVPAAVEAVIMHALAKEAEARPASAGAIAAELRKALRDDEAKPDAMTEVDLLTAQHPVEGMGTDPTELVGDAAVSATVTADRGVTTKIEGGGVVVSATLAAQVATAPLGMAAPLGPSTPPHVDRNAPTRISPPEAVAPIQPANDTRIDAPVPPPVIQTAPMPMPVPMPRPPAPMRAEIPTVHTRPKSGDRAAMAAVAFAAMLAVAMILGAVALVRHPWDGHGRGVGATVGTAATH